MSTVTFIIFAVYVVVCLAADERPVVQIESGVVRGVYRSSYDGRKFSSFEGIPYAKPPIGELRFKEPEPIKSWTGTWEANTKHICAQLTMGEQNFEGDEDCLYINVYVPLEKIKGTENFDVIVHIHGGAFMMGHPHMLIGPEYLMDRDVVFVTFNYRLGIFGFLSTQDEVLPGNHGLRDQTLALKWIQENIDKFGGNPNSVTLTGMSAGGASVHYHYISPLSKGLFHRGFSQSGTVLNTWALQQNPVGKSKKLAAITGCYDKSSAKIVKCLRQRSAQQILEALKQFYVDNMPLAPFGPTVERFPEKAFLPNHPYYLVRRGIVNDVPWIISVTTHEGIIPAIFYVNNMELLEKNWVDFAPLLLDFNFTASETKKKELPVMIKDHYFGNKSFTKDNIQCLVQLLSDRLFTIDVEKAVRAQAESIKSPVYFFRMGFKGEFSIVNFLTTESIEGVSHGDDIGFYLYSSLSEAKLSKPVEKMKNMFIDMLVTYSNTNKPKFGDTEWKPVSRAQELAHVFIKSPDDIKMDTFTELGDTEFWKMAALRENDNVVLFPASTTDTPVQDKKEEL